MIFRARAIWLSGCFCMVFISTVRGGASYLSGTAFYAHDLSVGTTSDGSIFTVSDSAISSSSNLSRLSYTLNRNSLIGGQADHTSSATARAGFVANSTTATVAIKGGTGLSQVDPPGGTSWPYSELKIDFRDATPLRWALTDPGLGPPASKYASFTVTGNVGSEAGSFARFFVNLAIYRNSISGANQLATINLDTGTITTAGTFNKTLTSSGLFSSNPSASDNLLMIGTIVLQANNGGTPTDLNLVNGAFGTAVNSNSSTYVGPTADNNWFTQANWSTNDDGINPPSPPVIPSQIDHRATFPSDMGVPRTVGLNGNVTLGVLESSGSASTTIQTDGVASLTFATISESDATIWQTSDGGEASLIFNTNVALALGPDPFAFGRMAVINDSMNPVVFNQSLSGPGNGRFIKRGDGPMHVNGSMSFDGEIRVDAGELKVNGTISNGAILDVNQGGTLSGVGNIQRPVSINSGGKIAPGNGIGTLSVSEIGLNFGSTYVLELDVVSPTTSADQISVSNSVFLDAASLQFKFVPAAPVPGPFTPQSFVIINNTSGGVFGQFDGLMDDVLAMLGLIQYSVNYDGGDGNDVVLTIHSVPEPAAIGPLVALAWAGYRRRLR
jgi:hypothetical protein